jgi:PAS domain S-box-containing protein
MTGKSNARKSAPVSVADLRRRLAEAEQTLEAIRSGEVDALLVSGEKGDQIYTLKSSEYPYRVMIEQMSEGALKLSSEGLILYCNASFARMVNLSPEKVIATTVYDYIDPASQDQFRRLVRYGGRREITLRVKDRPALPTYWAVNALSEDGSLNYSAVVTDLSAHVHNEQIVASEKFIRTILEQAADAILVCDTSGIIINASEKAMDILDDNLVGRSLDQVFNRLLPAADSGLADHIKGNPVTFSTIRDEEIPSGIEMVLSIPGRDKRTLLYTSHRVLENNVTLGYSITLSDITERKRSETERQQRSERLEKLTSRLEVLNQELESFSYSVSHDLRAPLRALNGFSEAVLQDYGDKLDEKGKEYLNRIRNAGQTMTLLIDDMLKLSRIVRAEIQQVPVNITDLARTILAELQSTFPDRRAEIIVSPEMTVKADRSLQEIALRNLLENAWKYTSKVPQARIEVGQTLQGERKVFYIRDNGVGFNMRYADKLFQPFQRLHSAEEYPGTGVGLAIVRRIIRRHGGEIWAESEPGKGAAFYFTLNKG